MRLRLFLAIAMTRATKKIRADLERLLPDALYTWIEIEPFVKVARETWRKRVIARIAPQPRRIGSRGTRYLGRDVLRWIESPDTYQDNPAEES